MVRLLLRSYIKHFLSLFIALIFLGAFSTGLFNSSLSAKMHLHDDPETFFQEHGYISGQVDLVYDEREEYEGIKDIEGVDAIEMRLVLDGRVTRNDGQVINGRVVTYTEGEGALMRHYVLESMEKPRRGFSVAMSERFATNAGFSLGDEVEANLGLFSETFTITEIVDTVEGIYPRFNSYAWSDDHDFGYLYFKEADLNKLIEDYAPVLKQAMSINRELRDKYQRLLASTNLSEPDLGNIGDHYASTIANQIIIKALPGYSEEKLMSDVNTYLSDRGIEPVETTIGIKTPTRAYMKSVNKQLGVAFTFLPVFFFLLVTVINGLFISTIIAQKTRDIGIMLSNGVKRSQILAIFLSFSLLAALLASLIGIGLGYGLSVLMVSVMRKAYCIATIGNSLDPLMAVVGILVMVGVAVIATLVACLALFHISPKDASLANESRRKPLPHRLERGLSKMRATFQIALNSIYQNKRRFFISTFSIGSAFLLILLCGFFYVSKTEIISQSCNRRLLFDCQVYMTEVADDEFIESLRAEKSVNELLDCYYTYAKVDAEREEPYYLECIAYDPSQGTNMVGIPSSNGFGILPLPEQGVILPINYASDLGLRKGDSLYINGVGLEIAELSYQYFHPIAYLAKGELQRTGIDYVSSFLINTDDEASLSSVLSEKIAAGLFVFTNSLEGDLHDKFDTLDLFLCILIGFSFSSGLLILYIMSKNSLLEQQRQLSLYRALGFRVRRLSNIVLIERGLQLLIAMIFAIPLGALLGSILFSIVSSSYQIYPFIFSAGALGVAFGFVVLVMLICHLFYIYKIKRLDLASNLRSGE